MKVLVVSDTHVPTIAQQIPEQVIVEAKSCSAIVHAGDIVSKKAFDRLSAIAPTTAVRGNMDLPELSPILPARRIIKLEKWRIGIAHGHEGGGTTTVERARNAFTAGEVDCVVFGHSHVAMNERIDGMILFNPGSPVAGRGRQGNTFGILELEEVVKARIVPVIGQRIPA